MYKKKKLFKHTEAQRKDEMASRRQFLKKAAYAAPTVVALGHLVRPTNALADSKGAVNDDPKLGTPNDFWNN